MKLLRLTTESVRGVPDGTIALASPPGAAPATLSVIAGCARSGKTALLESVAALCSAVRTNGIFPAALQWVRSGARAGVVRTVWELSGADPEEQVAEWYFSRDAPPQVIADEPLAAMIGRSSPTKDTHRIELFGARRSLEGGRRRPPSMRSQSVAWRYPDALPDAYETLPWLLADSVAAEGARLERVLAHGGALLASDRLDPLGAVKLAIAQMLPDLRLVGAEVEEPSARLLFQRRGGAVLELAQLSDSERQAVLIAAAIHYRPLSGSVILVDSPELHVASDDQARFVEGLATIAGTNQLIVATGSERIQHAFAANVVARLDSEVG